MMRTYEIMLLRFTAAVHFGSAHDGGGLEEAVMTAQADTFYSALCREAADQGEGTLARLVDAVDTGRLLFSSLLPWYDRGGGAYELYLPRPMTAISSKQKEEPSLEEARAASSERKKLKKRGFIRASEMKAYRDGLARGKNLITDEPDFGAMAEDVHFNGRTRKPYTVASWYFAPEAGLYIILSLDGNEDEWDWFRSIVESLGRSGIGGRRSSGLGKFRLEDEPAFLDATFPLYTEDDKALAAMLSDEAASVQMTLSAVLPAKEDIPEAAQGTGKLLRRSGFASSRVMGEVRKMNSIYMMAVGSCFFRRIAGTVADVNQGKGPHPVYKYGKGLYVGLP